MSVPVLFLGNVTGRGAASKPDFVVETPSGATEVVEAKFNKAGLTGAQKHLKGQIGDKFTVSRTTMSDVRNAGGAAGAGGAIAGHCTSGSSAGCK